MEEIRLTLVHMSPSRLSPSRRPAPARSVPLRSLAWIVAAVLALAIAPPAARGSIAGSWIWCSTERNPSNAYAYFRRSFTLPSAPTAATVRVTADTRYALYVNGRRVGRGPARSHTKNLAYDTWDVTADLRPGANVLAALVHHVGESTFSNQAGRAGFLCGATVTAGGQTLELRSDGSWKALASEAWDRTQPRRNIALGFAEVFDARRAPAGWQDPGYNDSAWPAATVLGPVGTEPWASLSPVDIPPNREVELRLQSVVGVLEVEAPPDAARVPFGRLYARNAWAVGYAATWLYAPRDTSVVLQVGSDDGLRLWVNGAVALERTVPRSGCPGQDTVSVALKSGWNPVLLKSAKLLGPWNAFLAVTGPGSQGVVVSSERNPNAADTWRVSPEVPFDGNKGILAGLNTVYPPETATDHSSWSLLKAPVGPMTEVAPLMRHEARRAADPALVQNADGLIAVDDAATFRSIGRRDGSVVLDMGRPVLGYPVFTIPNARGGEIVDVGYTEALENSERMAVSPASGAPGIVNPQRGDVHYADRFICRPGLNVFEPFEKRGFRYMQVDVRNAPEPIQVEAPTVVEALYPVDERGSFECSDARLNRVWDAARTTLRLNMDDAFTDCIWRERTQWWGDAHVEAQAALYAFGDTRLFRRGLLQAAESQDEEGIVRGLFPTDWIGARLPTYSLLWVLSQWEYYLHTGDRAVLDALAPAVDRLLEFFAGRASASLGLLQNVPYWVFVDWAPAMEGQRIGVSASVNAMYYRALVAAADIARARGDGQAAAARMATAGVVKDAFNARFWNPTEGLYDDLLYSENPIGRFTQQANSLAIAFGLAPRERWEGIVARMTTSATVTKTGTPYFGSFMLDAMAQAGRNVEALQYIRANWGRMLDWGSPTFWEMWEPNDSLTHGWAAGPASFLPARVSGVRPVTPGWKEWTLSPAFADLQWARASVPSPAGDIETFWTRRPDGIQVDVTVPAGTACLVRIPVAGLENARWIVMQGTRATRDVALQNVPGAFAARLTRPGRYTVLATVPAGSSSRAAPPPPASPARRKPGVRR